MCEIAHGFFVFCDKKIDSTGWLLPRTVIGWYSLLDMGDNGLNVTRRGFVVLVGGTVV